MRRQGGRLSIVAVAGAFAAVAVIGVSAAWACTAQPLMHLASAQVGEVGSRAKVEVPANQAVSGPVALRWNALDGPVLSRADVTAGTAATLEATIPEATPGVYYLVLETSAGAARTAFQVSGPEAASSPAPNPWASPAAESDDALRSFRAGAVFLAVGLVALSAMTLVALGRRRAPVRRPSA